MNCGEIRPLLSDYIDGEVTPEERKLVERHVATCEGCRQVLAEYRAIGGDLRAMPVPLPPAGLRRDVWRAIEARQGGAAVVKAFPSQGKIIPLSKSKNKPSVINIFTGAGSGWARALPAAILAAALLIVMSYFMFFNRTPVAVATIVEQGELTDYSQTVHVLLSKSVDGVSIENNTRVELVQGPDPASWEVQTNKVYRTTGPNSGRLEISPVGTWKPGMLYKVVIEAQNVQLVGVGGYLGDKPIDLTFSTAMYTPTPVTPTETPVPIDTPVPTNAPEQEPTVNAQETPDVPVVVASNTAEPAAPTATTVADTPVPPTATKPAPTNTVAAPTATRPVATATLRPTDTVQPSNTPAPTNTVVPPTATNTVRPTQTPTPSATRGAGTPTATPTATGTAQPSVTPGKGTPSPTPSRCFVEPVRGFGKIWRESVEIRETLGCPRTPEEPVLPAAQQHFQAGYMFWRGDVRRIYVFQKSGQQDRYGKWYEFADTWAEGEPVPTVEAASPEGTYIPVRGFGKLWANNSDLRLEIGYAVEPETAVDAVWQPFERGLMLWTSDRTIRVMYEDGLWESFTDTFVGE